MKRQFTEYWARARSMPLKVLCAKILQVAARGLSGAIHKTRDVFLSTYSQVAPGIEDKAFYSPTKEDFQKYPVRNLEELVTHTMNHRFSLLGSNWVAVGQSTNSPGSLKVKYSDSPIQPLPEPVNTANQKYCSKISNMIDPDYNPIDWHIDFKSGYRWNPKTWWKKIPYGHKPGVDIKVPWELSRMQHLPWLALNYCKTKDNKYFSEFRNQVLDFIRANPPRFGVNWKCPMDVAIRSANWVMAYDLFRQEGLERDAEFEKVFSSSLFDHGLFIENNFEKGVDFRGNHYLADIAGLTFIAYFLEPNPTVVRWRDHCKKSLLEELDYQFFKDGTNFEGSTAYHRLSSEMLFYPFLLLVLKNEISLTDYPQEVITQIIGMGYFVDKITKPDGTIGQIGDNDSGRFFKINPNFNSTNGSLVENHLDTVHINENIHALFHENIKSIEGLIVSMSFKTKNPEANLTRLFSTSNEILERSSKSKIENVIRKDYRKFPIVNEYVFNFDEAKNKNWESRCFKEFGLTLFKSESSLITFRCGPVGQLGRGGHDHNDQLSLEAFIDGKSIVEDPGTFIYTPFPNKRNLYRSNSSHFTPQPKDHELGDLSKGLFYISNAVSGSIGEFSSKKVVGSHNGFGFLTVREVEIKNGNIVVRDFFEKSVETLNLMEKTPLTYSPGYGELKI